MKQRSKDAGEKTLTVGWGEKKLGLDVPIPPPASDILINGRDGTANGVTSQGYPLQGPLFREGRMTLAAKT